MSLKTGSKRKEKDQSILEFDNSFESNTKLPKNQGFGEVRKVKLLSGISLYISNYRYFKDCRFKVDETSSCLGFGFRLSGLTSVSQDCMKKDFTIKANESSFYHFSDMKGSYSVQPNDHILSLGLQMKPDFFYSIMEDEHHYGSSSFRKFIDNQCIDTHRDTNIVTPEMKKIILEILNCTEKGLLRRFFFESKVMELIFLKIKQLEDSRPEIEKTSKLNPGDMDKVLHSGEVLAQNLENPPGLAELSSLVGLSRTSLLKNFSKAFGVSPYRYLRNLRLEKADILFKEGEKNITEVAFRVGYSSSSHFTKVFKKYKGMTPSNYIKNLHL